MVFKEMHDQKLTIMITETQMNSLNKISVDLGFNKSAIIRAGIDKGFIEYLEDKKNYKIRLTRYMK